MSRAKNTVVVGIAATLLVGCGTTKKPVVGTLKANGRPVTGHGVLDDPRTKHLKCMEQDHLHAVKVGTLEIQVDSPPGGPRIMFLPTPGAAQEAQISGQVQGAEVIGSALLYPDQAPDKELQQIEDCLAQGVSG